VRGGFLEMRLQLFIDVTDHAIAAKDVDDPRPPRHSGCPQNTIDGRRDRRPLGLFRSQPLSTGRRDFVGANPADWRESDFGIASDSLDG
jgi:hypothetical protein